MEGGTDIGLWDCCAICGNRIETGEPCIGVDSEGGHPREASICIACAKIENLPGSKEPVSITDLLARAEAAEARAEKAEHDMKRIVNRSSYPCEYCTKEKCFATDMKRQCYDFVWDGGQKEE